MKKLLSAAVLSLTAVAASAGITGTVKYDYDRVESASPWLSAHRATASLGFGFDKLGTVDVGAVAGQAVIGGSRINTNGFDLGYSNGIKLGKLDVSGRIGFSQHNFGRLGPATAVANVTSLAVNAAYPLTTAVSVVGGVEHLRGRMSGADGIANRGTVGVEYAVAKNISVKGVLARTRTEGENANGLTAAVTYKF